MKTIILAAAFSLVASSAFAASCKVEAGSKKLSGAAMTSFMTKCETDAKAAYVKSRPVSPMDLMATVFHALGIDQKLQYAHPNGRPLSMIEDGKPMEELI